MDQNTLLVVGILALVLIVAMLAFPRLKALLKGPGVQLSIEGERSAPVQPPAEEPPAEKPPAEKPAPAAPTAPTAPGRSTTIHINGDQEGQIVLGDGIAAAGDVHIGPRKN